MSEIKVELENEYGAVSINLETGEYSDIKKEDDTFEVVE
jgi:pyridoxine 5'-phosphate synthase PdxJ